MPDLKIKNLQKIFSEEGGEEVIAVDDVSISIGSGEFIVLVGPSGCGKTTTLRCIAGLEEPTSGDILLDGESIVSKQPADRDIAMVFQNYALYPHMTAAANIGFGLKMGTNMSAVEIEQKVNQVAEMMGIENLLGHKPGDLSGGQQQRVALGRAIVRDPAVFLMDEPLSNLDAKLRTQMRTELQNLQNELGTTTVYVTHDQTEAMTMGDRIAIMSDGKLQQLGTPIECYHQPKNVFVAGFIGSPSMNFFSAGLISDSTLSLSNGTETYDISGETKDVITDQNTNLTLGIRPEDIRIADESEPNAIEITANVVEPLGEVSYVYFDIDDQTYTASIDGDIPIKEGSKFPVVFPEDRIHLFESSSGKAIKNREFSEEEASTWTLTSNTAGTSA